jgi:uncharacterized membrane protein
MRRYLEIPVIIVLAGLTFALIINNAEGLLVIPRLALSLLFLLYIPGFLIQQTLFPRRAGLDGVERFSLSVGISLAIIPPAALILDALPAGITLPAILAAEAVILTVTLLLYTAKRMLTADDPAVKPAEPKTMSRSGKVLAGGFLLLMLAFAIMALIMISRLQPAYTEFYLLGEQGQAQEYPREVMQGGEIQVRVGVENHEGTATTYRIAAVLDQTVLSQNDGFILQPDQVYIEDMILRIDTPASDASIQLLLFRADETTPYRTLRLWLRVDHAGE